jgi:serine/alanine adding enzyme
LLESEITLTNSSQKLEWNNFIAAGGCVFHLFEWREVIEETFGYKPLYFAARQNGQIVGVLPSFMHGKSKRKRIDSLPFSDYAGPLSTDEAVRTELVEELYRYSNVESVDVEFRLLEAPKTALSLYSHPIRSTFILTTSRPFDEVWRSYDRKIRNSVRKSIKEGVAVKEADDPSSLMAYYNLHLKTNKRLGSFPYPFSFFNAIWSKMHTSVKLFMAFHSGLPIGGLFCFVFNGRLHIWGNASDGKLKLGQNDLLFSSAIEWACKNGVGKVDFGSTVPSTTQHFFKSRWGAVEQPIYYLNKDQFLSPGRRYGAATGLVKHLPSSVAKSASKFVYKNYY